MIKRSLRGLGALSHADADTECITAWLSIYLNGMWEWDWESAVWKERGIYAIGPTDPSRTEPKE